MSEETDRITRLSLKIARGVFRIGDELNDPCQRIQFLGGAYPGYEHDAGGINESGLAIVIEDIMIKENINSRKIET